MTLMSCPAIRSVILKNLDSKSPHYQDFCALSASLRKRIVQLRSEKNLQQEDIISHGISVRQYQRIESGDTQNVSLATLFRIAKALDISLSELLKGL